jgi:hypothetical protein
MAIACAPPSIGITFLGSSQWSIRSAQCCVSFVREPKSTSGPLPIVYIGVFILVPLAGIEPALLAELDFESSASTSSATGAFVERSVVVLVRMSPASPAKRADYNGSPFRVNV